MSLNIPANVKEWIKKSLDVNGRFSHNKSIKLKTDEVNIWMESCSLSERQIAWLVLHDLDDVPCCRTCGKPLSNFEIKGTIHCSKKCAKNDPETARKLKETNLAKYGTECTFQAKEVKEKIKASCIERYGVENAAQNEDVRERMKHTLLERYGVDSPLKSKEVRERFRKTSLERYSTESPMQSEEVRKRAAETCIRKYGHLNPMQSEEVRKRAEDTNLKKYGAKCPLQNEEVQKKATNTLMKNYGVDSPLKSKAIRQAAADTTMRHYGTSCSLLVDEVKEKIRQANIERYGYANPMQSEEVKERVKNTCIEKYGVECTFKSNEVKHKIQIIQRSKNLDQNIERINKKGIEVLTSKEDCIADRTVNFKCSICGTEFSADTICYQGVHCPTCLKKTVSAKEKQVLEYVQSIYSGEIVENDRKQIAPYELDIYVPDRNLAIEFNGTYWHSNEWKPKSYHLDKTLACNAKGIRLIHVFEWEWDQRAILIKALIKNALDLHDQVIYARQCEAREISQSDYKAFLSLHHLQGPVNSSIRIGLFFQNEPIMVAGWGRSRFQSKDMELHRLCTKEGMVVVGGFSKLIAHSGLEHFISYVDRAHFTGDGYRAIGFKEIGSTPPGYRWVNADGSVISRQMAQKSRLPKLLGEAYDPSMTEVQNMAANGWHQVFDCGNLKLEWIKK